MNTMAPCASNVINSQFLSLVFDAPNQPKENDREKNVHVKYIEAIM